MIFAAFEITNISGCPHGLRLQPEQQKNSLFGWVVGLVWGLDGYLEEYPPENSL